MEIKQSSFETLVVFILLAFTNWWYLLGLALLCYWAYCLGKWMLGKLFMIYNWIRIKKK